jgi:hypothetical protein
MVDIDIEGTLKASAKPATVERIPRAAKGQNVNKARVNEDSCERAFVYFRKIGFW